MIPSRVHVMRDSRRDGPVIVDRDALPADSDEIGADWSTLTLIGIGIVVRVAQYAFNRSLWFDEAKLALNIVDRSMSGLMEPLAEQQAAPLGFLIVEKAAALTLGPGEHALRLFPLACGLASLWLFSRAASRILPRRTALFSLAVFALAEPLIYFSSELKQYSSDVMVAVTLLLVGLDVRARDFSPRALAVAAVLGAASVWLSHPAAFVLAGIGSTWLIVLAVRSDWRRAAAAAGTAVVWLASFGLLYLVSLRQLIATPGLQAFWSTRLLELPTSVSDWGWWSAAAALAITGLVSLRRSLPILSMLVLPAVVGLAAGILHLYPFSGRLLLFLFPALVIVGAAGAGAAAGLLERKVPHGAAAFLAIVLVASSLPAAYHLIVPREREEMRQAVLWMAARFEPGDEIYLYSGARPAYEYYRRVYSLRYQFTIGVFSRIDRSRYVEDLEKVRGRTRIWVLFSHVYQGPYSSDEQEFYLTHLDQLGKRLQEHSVTGAGVYLYDLSAPPTRYASTSR